MRRRLVGATVGNKERNSFSYIPATPNAQAAAVIVTLLASAEQAM
jgi:hypothetical protein